MKKFTVLKSLESGLTMAGTSNTGNIFKISSWKDKGYGYWSNSTSSWKDRNGWSNSTSSWKDRGFGQWSNSTSSWRDRNGWSNSTSSWRDRNGWSNSSTGK